MLGLAISLRTALVIACLTVLQTGAHAAQVVIPPPTPTVVDLCGTAVADPGCGLVLETIAGGRYYFDDWTDSTTGATAQPGDEVRVVGEIPFGLCWNECQPVAICLFNTSVSLSCTLEIRSLCFGDGALTTCPCGNHSPMGSESGCINSTSLGARMVGLGTAFVALDDLQLSIVDAPAITPGLVLSGQSQIAVPFKDGVLCAGNPTQRLLLLATDASGACTTSSPIAALDGVVPGDERVYQFWFRDPQFSPCGTGSNLSNAVRVIWQ